MIIEIEIDIDETDKIETCKFGQTCLKNFDLSLCCTINREGEGYLVVTPVSTFKSSNCSFVREMPLEGEETHVCTCPVRLKIYKKYKV